MSWCVRMAEWSKVPDTRFIPYLHRRAFWSTYVGMGLNLTFDKPIFLIHLFTMQLCRGLQGLLVQFLLTCSLIPNWIIVLNLNLSLHYDGIIYLSIIIILLPCTKCVDSCNWMYETVISIRIHIGKHINWLWSEP